MGGSQSQSYDLSNESMKSVQDMRDIVPSNNVVDGKLIHITSAESSNILPNAQELQRIPPPDEIPLTLEDLPVENMPIPKTSAPKITETVVE
uniref:Reverse transcriptase domain-containing protein n=1 Tax=Elaeophora elaphi TaxID=1147741 RepID=A0A0R3RIW9_9BILA